PAAVSGSGVHDSAWTDRRTLAAPHATPCRPPGTNLAGRQIERVGIVRVTAATLCRVRVNDALPKIESVRLAVGRHKLFRSRHVLSIRDIDLVQASVPGDRHYGVFAGRTGRLNDRRGRDAAGAEGSPIPLRSRRRCPGVFKMLFPDEFTGLYIDLEEVVGNTCHNGDLFGARGRVDLVGN